MTKQIMTADQLLRSKDDLLAHIESTKLAGKALDKAIQVMLSSACLHAHLHGDFGLVNTTIAAINKGSRTNAAREFALMFAPVNFNEKKKEFIYAKTKQVEDFENSELFAKMLNTDWVDLKPEQPFRPFDLQAQLTALLKKAEQAAGDEEHVGQHKVDGDEIQSLKDMVNTLEMARKAKETEKAAQVLAAEGTVTTAAE
ncbi:MAG: hypothetical protein ACRC0G_09550 [Fusobacteriaceae bacterium]